jgi:energy-coupling factor transporter transmembrane protein EcfT
MSQKSCILFRVRFCFYKRIYFIFLNKCLLRPDEMTSKVTIPLFILCNTVFVKRYWVITQSSLFPFFFILFSLLPLFFLTVFCPNCRRENPAYKEIQTRSADEPATTFYACLNEDCKHRWNDWCWNEMRHSSSSATSSGGVD